MAKKKNKCDLVIKEYILRNLYREFPESLAGQRKIVKLFYNQLRSYGRDNFIPVDKAKETRTYEVAFRLWNNSRKLDWKN